MQKKKSIAVGVPARPVMEPADIITMPELAERLKVSERWVYEKSRRRCQNPLPVINVGRYLRFHWPTVSAWLHAQQRGA
jgi:hypothetical protein